MIESDVINPVYLRIHPILYRMLKQKQHPKTDTSASSRNTRRRGHSSHICGYPAQRFMRKVTKIVKSSFWFVIYPFEVMVFELEWGNVEHPTYSREQLDDYWSIYWNKIKT